MRDVYDDLRNRCETVWINPEFNTENNVHDLTDFNTLNIKAAQNRLIRFMPYIRRAFPETLSRQGIIESELKEADKLREWICGQGFETAGKVYIKDDAHLPIAGSVKARGGIYEVLCHAESLAMQEGLLKLGDTDYSAFDSDRFRQLFGSYTIQVGSTGNLGLSIGIMSAKLGFRVIVHMSREAKEWKKELLRQCGVTVKEYGGNYSDAVAAGRQRSENDPMSIFIDDENSKELFYGYSTAALRLKVQLDKAKVTVDDAHPLFVYLPCGVGGAPGGITYGLKYVFGRNVHCFFAEPTAAPCFTLGMASEKYNDISIYDIGLDGRTIADGLAVGRASAVACGAMRRLVSGSFTVSDDKLIEYCRAVYDTENIMLEPSACAGVHGIMQNAVSVEFKEYVGKFCPDCQSVDATHIIWATGGGLLPKEDFFDLISER